ncbi:hypothetical protein LLH03_08935 [bacterium]|nr:hypothetical protein [bacterium]
MSRAISLKTEGNRTYLEGVRPLDWSTGEMCEFASALTRMVECVGEEVPYHSIMGVTGVAFRFTMGHELWNPGFYGFESVSADVHDLFRRAFDAVGYRYRWHPRGNRAEDLQRITDSISRGLAVMLRGHVVDASDWVLITGYESGGDILLGSSPYGGPNRFRGYDVIKDWHGQTREYLTLGAKCEALPLPLVYTEALQLAVELVRTPEIGGRHAGLKAYEVLASTLRNPEFAQEVEREDNGLWFRYLCVLCYNMMLDDHTSAAPFLRDAAQALPGGGTELLLAAEGYERSCELRYQLEDILKSDFSQEAQQRLLDPEVRERYAQTLLEIRDSDAQAVSHIEQSLVEARHD